VNERRRDLRRELRARRLERTEAERRSAAIAVRDRLVQSGWLPVETVALYRPNDGEIDPGLIGAAARETGSATFYPSVEDGELHFVEWDGQRPLRRGAFGIEVPDSTRRIPPEDLGLVIVPLVGFDQLCHRIGMGRGFYDRAFSFTMGSRDIEGPRLVGLAFDEQCCDRIDPRDWDVVLDAVVTPTRTIVRA
jgi:5-formyltetrahydrofolate cyclo-ligase